MWQVARRINKKRGRKKSWYRGHAMLKSKQGFNHFEKKESKMEWHVYIQARWEKEKKKKRVAQKKSPYEINGGNGSMSSGDELPVENGSAMHISSPTPKEQEFSLPLIHGSNGTISTKNSVDEDANPDVTTRYKNLSP